MSAQTINLPNKLRIYLQAFGLEERARLSTLRYLEIHYPENYEPVENFLKTAEYANIFSFLSIYDTKKVFLDLSNFFVKYKI